MRRFVKIFTILLFFQFATTGLVGVLFFERSMDLTVFLNKLSILFIFLFILSLFATYFIVKREEEVYNSIASLINQIKDEKELVIPETDDEVLYKIYSAIKRIYNILKAQKEKVIEEKERLSSLVNNLREGLVVVDGKGNIKLLNRTAISILGLKGDRGNIFDICDDYTILTTIEKVLKSGTTEERLKVGGVVLLFKLHVVDGDYIILVEDITKRDMYEQMKARFFEEASHELKTPITSIMGFAETLMENQEIDEETKGKFLSYIYENSKQLSELIEDILTLHRLEKEKSIKKGECSLEGIENELRASFLKPVREKGIEFTVECYKGKVSVPCEYIKTILWNLTDNAVKFTDRGYVRVKCEVKDNRLFLTVEDSGMGIGTDEQRLIFERFYTSKVSRDRRLNGTGLGLSIVKHITERLKGEIELKSEKGKGSVFRVSLPLDD